MRETERERGCGKGRERTEKEIAVSRKSHFKSWEKEGKGKRGTTSGNLNGEG